jgi:epoxyqueuosine reductase
VTLEARAAAEGLRVVGIAPLLPADGLPARFRSVLLLAPDEPGFWERFSASPEANDGRPDPMDRWSRRVVGRLACAAGGKAMLPFAGPPWRPFIAWALRAGTAWASPVTLLVDGTAGLWASFRGGIALREEAPAAPARARPCETCSRPCLTACPVGALTAVGYDVAACHPHLDRPEGRDCLQGCLVRRACPVGAARRPPPQSAFHMAAFHPGGAR